MKSQVLHTVRYNIYGEAAGLKQSKPALTSPIRLILKLSFLHLSQGAKVDPLSHDRQTPLFLASKHGATEAVQLLVDKGADIVVRDVNLQSVMHAAVGFHSTMEILLQVGIFWWSSRNMF